MTGNIATTPFGGGRITAPVFSAQHKIREYRARLNALPEAGSNDSGCADKWQLLRALTEARVAFGLSDRTIAVLEALLSFHQTKELDGRAEIIVFPSNAELSLRMRGMASATLRRHIAALVEAGLIFRRDSPNGKRYCQRDGSGEIRNAFGFDLSPLALRAADIFEEAEKARDHARAVRRTRGEITIHLRDIANIVEAGLSEERTGDWDGFADRLLALSGRVARYAPLDELRQRCDGLLRLRAEVELAYLNSLSETELSANDLQNERHIQNSKTEPSFERSPEKELKQKGERQNRAPGDGGRSKGRSVGLSRAPEAKGFALPLDQVLAACPQFSAYAKDGIVSWRDAVATAALVRSMLGISPDAWERACATMGEMQAAAAIAAMLERADAIRSPGGYLRALTKKAEDGKFSVRPMLDALHGMSNGKADG